MPTYATASDFVIAVPGFVIEDGDALDSYLEQAEADIDAAVGVGNQLYEALKFNPDELDSWRKDQLAKATCFQAEYRMHMGDQFFVEGRQKEVTGRDSRIAGPLPYLAPKARIAITRGHLFNLIGARARSPIPNQNTDDIIP